MTTSIQSTSWHSYPKVYALGHPAIAELLDGPVTVEEKIDGSQFSFGVFDGELRCRSKGKELVIDNPEKLFDKAVETALSLAGILMDGWTYRAEYLRTPRHNTLKYDRIPKNHLILFDVSTGHERYLDSVDKRNEAHRLNLELAPIISVCSTPTADFLRAQLEQPSVLGGTQREGVVIKNYARFGKDGKALMGKYVREDFKEANQAALRVANPKQGDIIQKCIETYKTDARWRKAVQHLSEDGALEFSPRDIGVLLKEVDRDLLAECSEEISKALSSWAMPKIARGIKAGFPEWYKDFLMEKQFSREKNA